MNKIIIANMKMNLNYNEIKEYLKNVNKDVIYIPSAIYIPYFIERNLKCGIQNISIYEEGNHTGEISVLQASSLGIKYVIVSHSEINDSAFNINQKIKLCLKYNLTPILCIGEKLKTDDIKNVIINKLDNYLKDITDINKIIFAYEPEWIIGKNDSVDIKIVDDIISFIKKFLYQKYKISDIMVLYGGSINSYNVKEIINVPYIDGILVGNNSTNIEEFSKIIEVALS